MKRKLLALAVVLALCSGSQRVPGVQICLGMRI